jgi:hypothetical protein
MMAESLPKGSGWLPHFADKLLASEHADVLRQSVAWIVAEVMDAEVAAKVDAELSSVAPQSSAAAGRGRARPPPGRAMAVSRPQPWSLTGLAISIPSAWSAVTVAVTSSVMR